MKSMLLIRLDDDDNDDFLTGPYVISKIKERFLVCLIATRVGRKVHRLTNEVHFSTSLFLHFAMLLSHSSKSHQKQNDVIV